MACYVLTTGQGKFEVNPILELCQLFCKKGKTKFAIKLLDELSEILIDPHQGFILGSCYQEIAEFQKAIDVFESCVEYLHSKDQAYRQLSICYANLLQIEKAQKYLDMCFDLENQLIAKANLKRIKDEIEHLGSSHGFWSTHENHIHSTNLARFISSLLTKDRNIYDFGCGDGFYLSTLQESGFDKLTGFEGSPSTSPKFSNIHKQDLAELFSVPEKGHVICLEVAEHIPREYENILISNITNACHGYLIFSWAVRGQGGTCHVNCRNNDEVLEMFSSHGFVFCKELTTKARLLTEDHCDWFRDTILIFSTHQEEENAIHKN